MIEDMGMSSVRLYLTGVNYSLLLNILVMTQKPEEMMQELERVLFCTKTIALGKY
jgi:hypothetical protein